MVLAIVCITVQVLTGVVNKKKPNTSQDIRLISLSENLMRIEENSKIINQ